MSQRLLAAVLASLLAVTQPIAAHAHHHDEKPAVTLGALTITDAFARAAAVPGGASAAYLTVSTAGAADRLLSAESPAAARVELHTHELDASGVARMREVPFIPVSVDAPAVLAPGGLHIMLMGLTAPLVAGDDIALTLTFETAGSVTLTVPVRAATPHRH